jgi:hypothetical protein
MKKVTAIAIGFVAAPLIGLQHLGVNPLQSIGDAGYTLARSYLIRPLDGQFVSRGHIPDTGRLNAQLGVYYRVDSDTVTFALEPEPPLQEVEVAEFIEEAAPAPDVVEFNYDSSDLGAVPDVGEIDLDSLPEKNNSEGASKVNIGGFSL